MSMPTSGVHRIAVVGAGEMGHGLAELAALRGFDVSLHDVKQEFVDRGMERIRWSLDKFVEKGELTRANADATLARIRTTTDLEELARDADLVIEAVFEDLELKKRIFADLDRCAPPHAVLASNTSGLSITTMGRATQRAPKVVGMHFFNPAVMMPLLEIVRGDDTSDDTIQTAKSVGEALGKTSIVCRKDVPGFITSRTIAPYMYEAAWIHHEEGVPKEVIDSALKFRVGFPMGPFELADRVGLDLLDRAGKAQGFAIPPPITERAAKGKAGQKSGEGFYDYRGAKPGLTPDLGKDFDVLRILAPVFNEAARLVEWNVAEPAEIDLAMRLGTAFPKGPLALADEYGLDQVLAALKGSKRYAPVKLLEDKVARGELGVKAGRGFYSHMKEEKAMGYETIALSKDPETMVATLALNRPDRMNSINPEMIDEIERALVELEKDDTVRCLVVTGSGEKAFSAGADVTAFGGIDKSYKAWGLSRRMTMVFRRLADFPKPTLAALNGYAFGGGLEMSLACDFRIAARRSKMGQTEINLGLMTGAGGAPRLVKLLGLARAKELVLSGARLTADEALAIGLVNRVVENDQFPEAVKAFATKLAKSAPVAYRLVKTVLNRAADMSIDAAIEEEALAFGHVMSTEDIYEGIQAFMEKREPKFKGE